MPWLLAVAPLAAWAQQTGSEQGTVPRPVPDPVQGGWDPREMQRAAASSAADGASSPAQFMYQQFRAERNLALEKGKGRLHPADLAKLQALGAQVEQDGDAVDAAVVRFHLAFPEIGDAHYQALATAAEKGSRADLLPPLLVGSVLRNDAAASQRWARELDRSQSIPPALMTVAEDLLASVENGAVLFTAGEMDSYPLWVLQLARSRRKDVQVEDIRLLDQREHRERVWKLAGGSGAAPGDAQAFLKAFVRLPKAKPVYLSLALGNERLKPFISQGYITGLAMRVSPVPVDNLPLLEERWQRFGKATHAGPLSRNYLVPGAMLLQHYRRTGQEQKAAELEHELRRLARGMGAEQELYKAGVLEH